MTDRTLIFGVESSCDETSCAVVENGVRVLSTVVASQIDLHARYGGVVPEIASRAHIEAVNTVLAQAIEQAGVTPADIAAVAVTNEPGLIGSLLVGVMAAKTLAWIWNVPLIGVNHVYAHAYAATLNAGPIDYPAVALICSGGHTALYRCEGPLHMELLGSTIDDAAGEAFDKVASILGLGYPGGPAIDRIAQGANPAAVKFPRSLLAGQSLDFSFSGLKTAVLYHVKGVPGAKREKKGTGKTGTDARFRQSLPLPKMRSVPVFAEMGTDPVFGNTNDRRKQASVPISGVPISTADIAASFQAAVVDVLKIKLRRAAKLVGARSLVLGGGVAANTALRAGITELATKLRCTLRLPEFRFCLDNAAMIAGLGYHHLKAGRVADLELDAHATVKR